MTYRTPLLEVYGPGGTDLVPKWGSRLIGVKIVTTMDALNDETTFMFSNRKPYLTAPPLYTAFTVQLGWDASEIALIGTYTLQRIHLFGNPRQGEQVHYICRSGRMAEEFNAVDSQHFSEDNGHRTLGDVFRGLFKSTGRAVKVSPALDSLPVPGGYHLRWNETAMDSAADLARDNGAVVKVMGDTIVILKMDLGENVAGVGYGELLVEHDTCYEYDIETEARFAYAGVGITWFNQELGRLNLLDVEHGGAGQSGGLPHPAPTEDAAKALAETIQAEWGREEATGFFVVPGLPKAAAGAFVRPSGFPDPIDSAKLQAEVVTHDVVPNQGWTTTIEVKQVPA